jgi:Na+-driven multidrug efflux pump
MGARDLDRARRSAWTGTAVAAAIGLIFTAVALFGRSWMSLFSTDVAIRDTGALYLLCQAVVFPFTGAGLACYFACLATGYASGPFFLALLRLILIAGGTWLALTLAGTAAAAFIVIAIALVLFGTGLLAAMRMRFSRMAQP